MRHIILLGGVLLLVIGSFVPGGTFLIALGMALIICTSPYAASCIRLLRRRYNAINTSMTWVEERVGEKLGDALRRTRPLESSSCEQRKEE